MNELQRLAGHFSAYGGKERLQRYEDSLLEDTTASDANLRHICNILKKSKAFPSYGELLNCLFAYYPETKKKPERMEIKIKDKCLYCDDSRTVEAIDDLNYIQLMRCRCNNNQFFANYLQFKSIAELPIEWDLTPNEKIIQEYLSELRKI